VGRVEEFSGGVVASGTVLPAVFVPMAFFTGSTGVIYRQFSVTIVASMLLSVFVALTITPAMCASLLRPSAHGKGLFGWFNRGFDRMAHGYRGGVARMRGGPPRWLAPYAVIVAAMAWLLVRLPTGFLPTEDQGLGLAIWTLPSGASLSRTQEVAKTVQRHYLDVEKANVESLFTVSGFSFV